MAVIWYCCLGQGSVGLSKLGEVRVGEWRRASQLET